MIIKGQLKLLVLHVLYKEDGKFGGYNGYEIIKKTAKLYGKKPSTGTIYPLLFKLREEGLIGISDRKTFLRNTKNGKQDVKDVVYYRLTTQGGIEYNKLIKDINVQYSKLISVGIVEAIEVVPK